MGARSLCSLIPRIQLRSASVGRTGQQATDPRKAYIPIANCSWPKTDHQSLFKLSGRIHEYKEAQRMSRGLKTTFLVHAIVSLAFGVVLYLIPDTWAALVNWAPYDPAVTRIYARSEE